jgi:hypothetical protein
LKKVKNTDEEKLEEIIEDKFEDSHSSASSVNTGYKRIFSMGNFKTI